MKNLEQIRAKNALEAADQKFSGKNDGDIVKKVPTMIMENGLLGAAAFAQENNATGYAKVFEAVITHLQELKQTTARDLRSFIEELVRGDSTNLRAVTSESIAYLSYLRRFAKKND